MCIRDSPSYEGIQFLKKEGDQFQYGGPHLAWQWKFPTPDGKAHFQVVPLSEVGIPEGSFIVSTRRGKQFNSMVHERKDAITGADREAVLMSAQDARRLGLNDDDPIVLRSDFGELRGRVLIADLRPGNLQVHWPEAEVLIDRRRRSPKSYIPDYNAIVRVERAGAPAAAGGS